MPARAGEDSTLPPPVIGKMGPYTVFLTPKPHYPTALPPEQGPPPVRAPPQQFHKPTKSGVILAFCEDAVVKLRNAHSSLDGHLARWFGLDQSKYQWMLEDYYESKAFEKAGAKS